VPFERSLAVYTTPGDAFASPKTQPTKPKKSINTINNIVVVISPAEWRADLDLFSVDILPTSLDENTPSKNTIITTHEVVYSLSVSLSGCLFVWM